ncbi:hypothetical protein PQQ84_05440 [Paraburkholderia strydomiana]|uniref:hypothetical protein n=1 Tax=Paraburkholderia strydomiana TaxID=1245417 RepID=UPI0038BB02F9
MKKLFAALAAGVVLLALSACGATAPTQNAAQLVATVQVKAQKVCTVSVPFLNSMTAMKSQLSVDAQGYLAVASDKVNAACDIVANAGSSASPISTDKITALVNDGVPALIKVIDESSLDKDAKAAAEIALTAAQLAVSNALADYLSTPAATTPDPASGAIAS